MPPPSNATPGQRTGIGLFFTIFLLAGGAFFYGMAAHPFFQSLAARNWVETPCRIVSSEVKSSHGNHGATYRPDIAYVYRVQGREYRSDRYQFLRFSSSGLADKVAVVARYPHGKTAICYVNPKAPGEAVLDPKFSSAGVFTLIPVVFMGIGAAGLFGAIRGGAQKTATPPGELWRERPDWAAGRIVSSTKQTLRGAWLFAAVWNLISFPIAGTFLNANTFRHGLTPAAFVLLFPLAGLGLLAWALLITLRWMRFGESVLEMAVLPGVPGGVVEGVVRLNCPIRPDGPVQVRLNCMERVTTHTSDGNSTSENLLWQHEEPAEMVAAGDALPVAFALPADARLTSAWKSGSNGVFWRLEVHAKLPGVDYKAQFELPVCAGELSPEEAAEAARVQAREQAEVATYVQPASSRVRITTPLRGGTEFYFPPGRSLVGTLVVLALLGGMGWWINAGIERHEWVGVFALGIILIIPVFILSYMWTAFSRVTVEAGMVTVTRKCLGIGSTQVVAFADIAKIRTEICESSSGSGGTAALYALEIVCRDETEVNVGGRVPEPEARWVAARIMEAVRKP